MTKQTETLVGHPGTPIQEVKDLDFKRLVEQMIG